MMMVAIFILALISNASGLDFAGAEWIGAGGDTDGIAFAKTFAVTESIKSATLHVTGLGFYEVSLNGRKIGDRELEPSPTDYTKRVLYASHPITGLRIGENTLKIAVGHGWYDLRSQSAWKFDNAPWRDRPKAIARLEMIGDDGSKWSVVTDESWQLVESRLVYDCLREGEIIDNRRQEGRPLGRNAVVVKPPKGMLQPVGNLPPAKVMARIAPQKIAALDNGRWLVTFPETLSGHIALKVRGQTVGSVITVRHDENLGLDGGPAIVSEANWELAQTSGTRRIDCFLKQPGLPAPFKGQPAAQIDRFICGGGDEAFEPRFVYHGFRYVLIEGLAGELRADDIRAVSIRSSFAETGHFSCSDAILTELVRMAMNSYKANFTDGIPTDCPHREKLGWTNDGWTASEVGVCFFDTFNNYGKWYQDILDAQREDGAIPGIVPTSGWGYKPYGGPFCDSVITELPWNLWTFGGDAEIVRKAYPAIRKYVEYMQTCESEPDLVSIGLGDWNAYDRAHMPSQEYAVSCMWLRIRERAAAFAVLCGERDDAAEYAAAAQRTRQALRRKYAKGNGVYDNGLQTAQALALELGICTDEERGAAMAKLVKEVEATGHHIDFGLIGSKFVYRALANNGRADLAYAMIVNPTEPSPTKWLNGNGTLWEDWRGGFSKCHIMLSDFASWSLEYIAGIRRPLQPGFKRLRIEPVVLDGMTWSKGELMTPFGQVKSSWKRSGSAFDLSVTIPSGVVAEVKLPNGDEQLLTGPLVCTKKCEIKE